MGNVTSVRDKPAKAIHRSVQQRQVMRIDQNAIAQNLSRAAFRDKRRLQIVQPDAHAHAATDLYETKDNNGSTRVQHNSHAKEEKASPAKTIAIRMWIDQKATCWDLQDPQLLAVDDINDV